MSSTHKQLITSEDPLSSLKKVDDFSDAALRRATSASFPFSASPSSAPPLNVDVVKLEECEEEFDCTIREAKFAFRSTDLGSWASSSTSSAGGENTDSDPKTIQHWALVVHFPRGKKTYLFEAWKDDKTGLLQAGRAEISVKEIQVFEKATYFGTVVETSPSELLTKAKQVKTGVYDVFSNNCQTWLREFLYLISPTLLISLFDKLPDTETYFSSLVRKASELFKSIKLSEPSSTMQNECQKKKQ